MQREPELADKLLDEMERAGRDYMRLREVEAERDEWKRRAEAAEAELQRISMASGLMRIDTPAADLKKALVVSEKRCMGLERQLAKARRLYETYAEHIQGCDVYRSLALPCSCGLIEAVNADVAAREIMRRVNGRMTCEQRSANAKKANRVRWGMKA